MTNYTQRLFIYSHWKIKLLTIYVKYIYSDYNQKQNAYDTIITCFYLNIHPFPDLECVIVWYLLQWVWYHYHQWDGCGTDNGTPSRTLYHYMGYISYIPPQLLMSYGMWNYSFYLWTFHSLNLLKICFRICSGGFFYSWWYIFIWLFFCTLVSILLAL